VCAHQLLPGGFFAAQHLETRLRAGSKLRLPDYGSHEYPPRHSKCGRRLRDFRKSQELTSCAIALVLHMKKRGIIMIGSIFPARQLFGALPGRKMIRLIYGSGWPRRARRALVWWSSGRGRRSGLRWTLAAAAMERLRWPGAAFSSHGAHHYPRAALAVFLSRKPAHHPHLLGT